jgi:hypothetical protein
VPLAWLEHFITVYCNYGLADALCGNCKFFPNLSLVRVFSFFFFLAETAYDLSVHGPYVVLICVDRGGILVVKRRDKTDSLTSLKKVSFKEVTS